MSAPGDAPERPQDRALRLALLIFRHSRHGGLGRDCAIIAEHLAARGHHVEILTRRWDGAPPPGIQVREVPVRALTNHGRDRAFAHTALALAQAGNFDAIVGFNRMPGLDIHYCGDTSFQARALQEHGALYRLTPRYRTYAAMEAAVYAPASATQIIMLALPHIDTFRRLHGTPPERFHLVPPGIARDRRRVADPAGARRGIRAELGVGSDETMLLMVGSGFRTKGVDRAIRALAALPADQRQRTRLVVIGSGRRGSCRRLARQLGIADRLLITPARPDVMACYAAADLLLHPARWENTGGVILEAMIAALPVLCTAACGFSGHVAEANAGIVLPEPFEQAALDRALAEMMDGPCRRAWSEAALEYATTADLHSGQEMAAILIEALTRRKLASPAGSPRRRGPLPSPPPQGGRGTRQRYHAIEPLLP
jgi:UDP-glucose:(heptosyl)LPS alpha-1,3-glucosyltransferase